MKCEECYYYTSEIYEDGSRSKPHCSWMDDIPPCDDDRFWERDFWGECDGICDLCSEGDTCALRED